MHFCLPDCLNDHDEAVLISDPTARVIKDILFKISPAENIVFQDAVNSPEAILCPDLLSFLIGAAVIRNTHFIDPDIRKAGYLGCDLRFKSKAVFLEMYFLDVVRPEELIACLHISKVQVREHV